MRLVCDEVLRVPLARTWICVGRTRSLLHKQLTRVSVNGVADKLFG